MSNETSVTVSIVLKTSEKLEHASDIFSILSPNETEEPNGLIVDLSSKLDSAISDTGGRVWWDGFWLALFDRPPNEETNKLEANSTLELLQAMARYLELREEVKTK